LRISIKTQKSSNEQLQSKGEAALLVSDFFSPEANPIIHKYFMRKNHE